MDQHARGRRAYEGLTGVPAEDALARIREQSPQMYATLVDYAAAGVVTHAELGWAERELVTVAVLAALGGAEGQLATHTRAALHQGHAASELLALCEHVALYAGLPRALNALAVVDEVLTASGLPGPPALRTVRLGDHDTVVARRGDEGPPVLLVHSLGVDWRMWEPVMERLAAGRRVFAYDIRGHGAAAGAPAATGMSGLGTDLVAVLDALELERAHVVGLSVGGAIGQTAAVLHPGRIASLALLAAPDHPVPEAFESRARAAETEGMDAQIAPTLTRWFTPRRSPRTPGACGTPASASAGSIRPTGPPPGGRTRPSTCGTGSAISRHRPWSSPENSTRRRRPRSCPGSPDASPAPSTGSFRAHPICRPSNSPAHWPTSSTRSSRRAETGPRRSGHCPRSLSRPHTAPPPPVVSTWSRPVGAVRCTGRGRRQTPTFCFTCAREGFVRVEPSGKRTVGTVWFPPFAFSTKAADSGSCSMLISVYAMPSRSIWPLSRRQ